MSDERFFLLPKRLQAKITRNDQKPAECWEWTGACAPARLRLQTMPLPKATTVGRPRGRPRQSDVITVRERALPKAHSAAHGYPVPAYKLVYSIVKGIPYGDLPRMQRCLNDRCVHPDHQHQTQHPTNKPGRSWHLGPKKCESVLEMLQRARPRPSTMLSPQTAAEELGIAEIPMDVWIEFVKWDEENPEDESYLDE